MSDSLSIEGTDFGYVLPKYEYIDITVKSTDLAEMLEKYIFDFSKLDNNSVFATPGNKIGKKYKCRRVSTSITKEKLFSMKDIEYKTSYTTYGAISTNQMNQTPNFSVTWSSTIT